MSVIADDNDIYKNIKIVNPDDRITSDIMTEYEYTEIVSIRAKQIEDGATCHADVDYYEPIHMAELEIKQRKCPLAIVRMHNEYIGEIWRASELSYEI